MAALSDLLTEGDLIGLLAADAIWGELAYTNRSYWRDRVNTWVNEVAAIAPRLRPPENSAGPPRPRPEFPALHRTPDAFIERLEREPIGEESQES